MFRNSPGQLRQRFRQIQRPEDLAKVSGGTLAVALRRYFGQSQSDFGSWWESVFRDATGPIAEMTCSKWTIHSNEEASSAGDGRRRRRRHHPDHENKEASSAGDGRRRRRQQHHPDHENKVVRVTAEECRCILAQAFLGNIDSVPFPHLWKKRPHDVGVQKVMCLLAYFDVTSSMSREEKKRQIVFEKVFFRPEEEDLAGSLSGDKHQGESEQSLQELFMGLKTWDVPYSSLSNTSSIISITEEAMEDPACTGFVNFANKKFGYGNFIPSCTQEEIMQMMCPEFNVGMLFFKVMEDECVVLARNIRRYCQYEGYLDTFRFCGAIPEENRYNQTIITMDAVFNGHYTAKNQFRDVHKAYLGFSHCVERSAVKQDPSSSSSSSPQLISTGQWGCGMFYGHPKHKFLQQVVATGLCGGTIALRFSSFQNATLANDLQSLWDHIQDHGMTPRQVYSACLEMKTMGDSIKALDFLRNQRLPKG